MNDNNPDLGSSYLGEDGKIHPVSEMKIEPLPAEKIPVNINVNDIVKPIEKKEIKMSLIKLIGGIVALIIAFVMTFIAPGWGAEQLIIGALASIFAGFGLTNWRLRYDAAKVWFKSKTIWGALLVAIPFLLFIIAQFFSFALPAWAMTAIEWIVRLGGGIALYGIFDAVKVNTNKAHILLLIMWTGLALYTIVTLA